jgi:hypothetical protein
MAEKTLSEQLVEVLNDKASKEDVSRIIKKLIDFVKEAKAKMEEMMAKHQEEMTEHLDTIADAIAQTESRASHRADQDKETMYSESRTLMRYVEQKLSDLEAKLPESYDDTEVRAQLEETRKLIPSLPEELSPEGIRNKLELFAEAEEEEKMDARSIRGFTELIERIEKLEKKSGGSSQMLVNHWPIHESFTMNGSDTTVTLRQAPGAAGNAIFGLRYQGQVQVQGTDYTVDGNKITFLTFTPEADTIVSITYLP